MKKNCIKLRKVVFSFFLVSITGISMYAQTGPGGVGSKDGSGGQPQNVIWFLADSLGLNNNDLVATWKDISGNGNDGVQSTGSAQPEYRTGQINTMPAVVFDGIDDFMPFDGSLITNSDYTVIVVAQRRSNRYRRIIIGGSTSAWNQNLHLYWNNSTNLNSDQYSNGLSTPLILTTQPDSGGTDLNVYGMFSTLLASGDATDNRRNYQNNQYLGSKAKTDPLSSYDGAAIARHGVLNEFNDIDVAELIVFSNALNDAQLQIVHQYLNVKYNINIANDYYNPDAAYVHNVAGIGEESNGQHSEAASAGMYLTALSGLNLGDYIFTSHNNLTNNSSSYRTDSDAEIAAAGVEEAYNRLWFIDTLGTPAAELAFDFSEALEDGLNPANISNYVLLYRSGLTGNFSKVKNADGVKNGDQVYFNLTSADLKVGYYTLGTEDATDSPLEGVAGRTWYTLTSGNWGDWEIWTLDQSGALPNNPNHYTPSTSSTSNADKVVIKTGRTVVVDTSNNLSNVSLEVDGRLDLTTTTGHNFGVIKGTGRILMAADNFPDGDASHFYSKGQGEGTVVYYGGSYNLNTAREFFDVEVILDDPVNTISLLNDYDINGNLTITAGKVQINDDTDDQLINLTVDGDVLVESNGKISVGTGNPFAAAAYTIGGGVIPAAYHDIYHQFNISGNFTNKGIVRFTNLNAPIYDSLAVNGAVTVRFKGASNAEINLYNTTDFYNLVIDKGTDKTYKVELYSDNTSYFTLFGANNVGITTGSPFSAEDPQNRKALFIYKGTLQLKGNIYIPTLGEGGRDFTIGKNARLWMDGSNVTVYSTATHFDSIPGYTSTDTYTADGINTGVGSQAMSVYGEFKITDGYFGTRNSAGFIFWAYANAQVKIEGGKCYVSQMRTANGGGGIASYIQTGGIVTVFGNSPGYGSYDGGYPFFGLESEDAVFQMSGGEIILQDEDGDTDPDFQILSSEGNYSVTGGKITIDVADASSVQVLSTANFWNLEINNSTGSGNMVVELDTTLNVANDLTLNSNIELDVEDPTITGLYHDVYIGRNFTIGDDALYKFHENTTIFNGTLDGVLHIGDITGLTNSSYTDPEGVDPYSDWEQPFYGFTINKPTGAGLTLQTGCTYDAGGTSAIKNSSGCKNIYDYRSNLIKVTGPFTLESGYFNIDKFSVRLYDEITNKGVFGLSGTPKNALIKLRKESSPTTRIVNTTDGSQFGNLRLNSGEGILEFTSDVYIKRMEYKHGRIDIGTHNLKIDTLVFSLSDGEVVSKDFSVEDMIIMDGNASDGGLSLYVPQVNNPGLADSQADLPAFNSSVYFFPIGTGTTETYPDSRYTPANIRLASVFDDGYVTVNIVSSQLQTAGPHPLGNDVLGKYFRIRTEGFSTPPKVERYRLHFTEADIPDGTNDDEMLDDGSQTWNPGYVIDSDPYTRKYEINNGATGSSGFENNGIQDIRVFFWGNEGSGNPAGGFDLIEANYTAGVANRFTGTVDVYYSIATNITNCSWNSSSNWTRNDLLDASYGNHDSRQTAASDYPQTGDIAVIGWCPWDDGNANIDAGDPHLIRLTTNIECAQLIFTPMEDISGNPRAREPRYASVFRPCLAIYSGINLTTGLVQGEGMFWCKSSDPDFSLMDLGEFAVSDSSYILYENYNTSRTYVNMPSELPNLMITSDNWGRNNNTTIIATDINTNGSFEIIGNANVQLNTGAGGDITIGDNLAISEVPAPDAGYPSGGGGEMRFQNSGNPRTITIGGDILLKNTSNRIYVENAGANNIAHQISVGGNISQTKSGDGLLFSSGAGNDHIDLTLNGNGSKSFDITAGNIPEFYRIILNKGTDQASSFTFNGDFNLNGTTSGAGVAKALELQNGTLVLNNADIDIDLTSGDDDFPIPSTACLQVTQGTVNVYGDDNGISLDGKLLVDGGTVDMINGAGNGNNYIEYSSSGNAEIEISDGNLWVGSQIRRGLITDEGILSYKQSGGNVQIGVNTGGDNDRSIFEILNTGSSFIHSGGDFFLVNDYRSGASTASMYFNPDIVNLSSGTKIQFGDTNTVLGESDFNLYAGKDMMNLTLNSTNSPSLTLDVVPLTLSEDLIISTDSKFDANGLDLTIKGDITVDGIFTSNKNDTYFSGSEAQQITGSPTFWNLYKTTSNQLSINNDVDVDNELGLNSGTFNDNDNTLSVQGTVNMDIIHTWGGTIASNGILMNGTTEQVLTGNGTFGKLSINNSADITVPQGNVFTINGALQLETGVFNIGKNLLVLKKGAEIIEQNAFSEDNMIQTNISFTDAGVKKFYPAIVPADNYNFIYPIGSEGKYTPVEINIDYVNDGGFIRVKAANEMHPTIINDDEPCNEIEDTANVLNYHWLMEANSISGFNANVSMKYYDEDYQENSTYYDITSYIAARLLWGSTLWNKYDESSFDETNNLLKFSFTNADDDGISGDYTAGIEDQAGTCKGAIPDEVPAYITTKNGDWTDASIWDTYPVSGGTVPSNGPRGAVAIVKDTVVIPSNYILSYKTTIDTFGMVQVGSTFGHRLGIVEGTGTLQLENGSLPAGIYDDFFSRKGGTLEFAGNTSYDVLSEVNNVRNIKFTGTGERRLPNLDFEVYGLFTIDGDDNSLEVINEHDRNMTLDSNIVFNQGSFDAGIHPSTVNLNGTHEQIISGTGSFTGTNAFRNVEIDNSDGITLLRPIEIDGTLDFISGIITTTTTNILTVDNSAEDAVTGYGSSNYVDGPMRKLVQTNGDFEFPVGDNGRYGQILISNTSTATSDYWEAEYHDANPITDPIMLDPASKDPTLELVSEYEYWRIKGPVSGTAKNIIRWDNKSIIPATTTQRFTHLKMVEWITSGTPDQWEEVTPAIVNDGGINSGTIASGNSLTLDGDHFFTIGTTEGAPLPAVGFISPDTSICAGTSAELRIQLTGTAPWTIKVDSAGVNWTITGINESPYTLITNPSASTTYTITEVTDATPTTSTTTVFGSPVVVTVVSIPTQYNVTGGGSYCAGAGGVSVGLSNSEIGVNYELFAGVNSVGMWSGIGAALNFGNQTNTGTVEYRVVATADAADCSIDMATTVNVQEYPLPVFTVSGSSVNVCDGDEFTLTTTFTTINTPYSIDIKKDGSSVSGYPTAVDISDNPNLYNENLVWTGPLVKNTFGYTVVITDINGCSDNNTAIPVSVDVYKVPETGPQYHISNDFAN